jgi:hypothetical protein
VIVLHVLHEDELRFPFDRLTRFEGLEDDTRLLVDPLSLREGYLASLEAWRAEVRRACSSAPPTTTCSTPRRRSTSRCRSGSARAWRGSGCAREPRASVCRRCSAASRWWACRS